MAYILFVVPAFKRDEIPFAAELFAKRGHRTAVLNGLPEPWRLIEDRPDVLVTCLAHRPEYTFALVRELRNVAGERRPAAFLIIQPVAEVGGTLAQVGGDVARWFDGVVVASPGSSFSPLFAEQLLASIGRYLFQVGMEPVPEPA